MSRVAHKAVNSIASCPPSPLSVRYLSARSGSVPGYDDGEGLKLELPLAQSAFSPLLSAAWLKIAVSIAPVMIDDKLRIPQAIKKAWGVA
jgi:hypothetical protein